MLRVNKLPYFREDYIDQFLPTQPHTVIKNSLFNSVLVIDLHCIILKSISRTALEPFIDD